jgi:hypothetical protein
MARPETINHSRIRRDCDMFFDTYPLAGSPHRRQPSASSRRRETRLRHVRSGERGERGWVKSNVSVSSIGDVDGSGSVSLG